MAETLTDRVGRLGAGSARALVLGGAAVAVLVVSSLLVVTGVDTVETVATLLVVPVFGVALYFGRGLGFGAAAVATGIYVVLRRPDYGETGSVSFAVLIVTRAIAYSIVAHAGAWARTLVSDASAAGDEWADSPLILREQRRARGERAGDVEPWTSASPVATREERHRRELATPAPTAAMAPALFGDGRDRDWDDEPHPSDWRVGPSALPPDDPESGPWTGPTGAVEAPPAPPSNGGGAPPVDDERWAAQGGSLGNPWSGQVPAVGDPGGPGDRWAEPPAARGPAGPGGPGDPWGERPAGPGEVDDRWSGRQAPVGGPDPWAAQGGPGGPGSQDPWADQGAPGGPGGPAGPGDRWGAPTGGPGGPGNTWGHEAVPDAADPWADQGAPAPGGSGGWSGQQPAARGPEGPGDRWSGRQPAVRGPGGDWPEDGTPGPGGPGDRWSGRQPAVGSPAGGWPDDGMPGPGAPGGLGDRWSGEQPAARGPEGPGDRWSGRQPAVGSPAGGWPDDGMPGPGAPGGPGDRWSGQQPAARGPEGPGDRWSGQQPAAAGPPRSGQWPAAEQWGPEGPEGPPGTVDWGDVDPLGPVERTPGADPWEQVQPDRMWRSRRDGDTGSYTPAAGMPGVPTPAGMPGPGPGMPGPGGPPVPAVPVPVASSLPAVDPETRLWSARYLCDRLATEQREAARAGRPFSLVLVQVPDGPLAALSYRRQVTLLRELGHQFVAGGLVDHLVHVPDQVQHWFAVILPDTDRGGAQGFERRLRNGIGGYLRSRGLLLGELESASLTSPDDDSALGVIWETLIARGEPDAAPGGPSAPGLAYDR
jgi:hypothetical protein